MRKSLIGITKIDNLPFSDYIVLLFFDYVVISFILTLNIKVNCKGKSNAIKILCQEFMGK